MMVTIMSVFGVCWLPYQLAILYNEHRADRHLPVTVANCLSFYSFFNSVKSINYHVYVHL